MLQFPKNYFQDETVDGFHIEAMMKCAWAAQLEVLEVLRELCAKHNITYFADWGTLLGAVRHQGFIPWDDDIDICMLRPDYERFLAIANQELPEPFHVHSEYSSNLYEQPFAVMVNAQTISYSPERLQQYHGCPYVVGPDIFPLDVLPDDKEAEEQQCRLYITLLANVQNCRNHLDKVMANLPELERMCGMRFDRNKDIKNQLLRALTSVSCLYNDTDATYMTHMTYHVGRKRYLRREWYRDVIWLPFENTSIPAPIDYQEALTALFNADYMIPDRQPGHEYPFYQKQHNMLVEALVAGRMADSVRPDFF